MQNIINTIGLTSELIKYDIEIEYSSGQSATDWIVRLSSVDHDGFLFLMGNDTFEMTGYVSDDQENHIRDIEPTNAVAKALHDWLLFDGFMSVTEFKVGLEKAGFKPDLASKVFGSDRSLDFPEIAQRLEWLGEGQLWNREIFWLSI